jgi:signal transduction histidine kinase
MTHLSQNEQKLMAMLKYAPVGLVEMDHSGRITLLNIKGEEILQPFVEKGNTGKEFLLPILEHVEPVIVERIKGFTDENGIISRDLHKIMVPQADSTTQEKHYFIMANKQVDGTVMLSIDDFTEKVQQENAMRYVEVEKAVEQSKFEIASGVLHDIGNAVVGFGSYLTRTRRLTEQNNLDNLDALVNFFTAQQTVFAASIGEQKAQALVDMLTGISKAQKENYSEISRSITEQLNIITHIQEILNIQRQYVTGKDSQDRKPVNLRSIINDCMAMLFASLDKRGIAVSLNIPNDLPVIKGDRTKLMQVVLNILKNSLEAIDFMAPNKNITIGLEASGSTITMQVKDTGCGFDGQIAGRLFERNFTTKSSGTGLGLHNCRAIIESHAGSMNIFSDGVGKGATTVIEFNLN